MNKRKAGAVLTGILLLLAVIGCIAFQINKDDYIIYNGLDAYRSLRTTLLSAAGALGVLFLGFLAAALLGGKKTETPVIEQPKSAPALSVKGKLENSSLRDMLLKEAGGRWNSLSDEIRVMVSQMEKMDSYQEKLHSLLQNNDIKALSDTEELLEQSEQCLCQNVRRTLNYMSVYDEKDTEALRATVRKTNEKNQEQLDQVRDFVVAVTDFVNQQGTEGQDPDMLNTYKNIILESLKEEN